MGCGNGFAGAVIVPPSDQNSGQWTAEYHGTIYVRLALRESAGTPQGAMSIGEDIHVNAQGDVDRVTEAPSTTPPMQDVHLNGKVLSFSVQEGGDIQRFELRLIDTSTGELTAIVPDEQRQELADDGIPLPKPFRVTKAR